MSRAEQVVDEPVSVVAADNRWPARFDTECARIRAALPADVEIEHFGSTAVPDLPAKPIVDILVGVAQDIALGAVAAELERCGYASLGEAGVPGRLYLRRRDGAAFNISVTEHGSSLWNDNLLLRDYLRADAGARRRYAEAKAAAVRGGNVTLLRYGDAKAAVVADLLAEARIWNRGR